MKIVHVIPSLNRGGAERFVVDICNELSQHHDVYLISFYANDENSFEKDLFNSVKLICLGKRKGLDLTIFFKLYNIIRRIDPDVVNTHISSLEYLYPSILIRRNERYFHTLHSVADKEALNNKIVFIRKRFFTKAVVPITISNSVRESFKNVYDLVNRDQLILNGRAESLFSLENSRIIRNRYLPNSEGFLFINVGRVSEVKNQLALIKAFNTFNAISNYANSLIVMGDVQDPVLYDRMINEIEKNSHKAVFLLPGKDNVADYLKASDAFCLVSIYEGLPISLIEAFSVGTFPLCTPVGGIRDMIEDGETGMLAKGAAEKDILDLFLRYIVLKNKDEVRDKIRNLYNATYNIKISSRNYLSTYL